MNTPPTLPTATSSGPGSERSDDVRFAEAVESANVPTLLMVLVQLTGEQRWLEEPYRPRKARGLSDNESGGLPVEVQAQVRAAALQAIIEWRKGAPVVVTKPSADLLIKMMGVAMGEEIPHEYAPMIAGELGLDNEIQAAARSNAGAVPAGFKALIIGGGSTTSCQQNGLKRSSPSRSN
jgi:4-hydroxyacetophenone monooxygenase